MVEVHLFGRKEMIAALRQRGVLLSAGYFGRRAPLARLITESVSKCTFRAFAHLRVRPSIIFREWAKVALNKRFMRRLARAVSQSEFDELHECLRASLAECWERRGGSPLKYGHGLKLINLLLKAVVRRPKISDAQREKLIPLLHVPLDKFSLRAVCRFSNSAKRFAEPVRIARNASMGFVKSEDEYRRIQGVMREVAEAAGVPPVAVDLLAWDHAHA